LQTTTFSELGLSSKVIAAIEAAGYTTPTPIQAQGIPVAVTGRDVLGIAQTGTGKTAAFVMPMISRLESGRARARMPRSLILAPTRELAAQVAQSFEKYGVNHKLDLALLIGGVSMEDQIRKVDRGVDVLIATPGRLLDLFGRGKVMLMGVEILVIDEADRMLDMGFIPDIEKICKLLPPRRQTLFFSATMPPEITRLVAQFLKDPVRIEVAKPATTAKTITQLFRFCPDGEDFAKREILRDLIRSQNVKNAIIFCNRKRDVAILLKSLLKHGFNAGALHGDMDQSSRTATLDKFRNGEITLLAASDVAARGLDIPDVSHVFNFDVPWQGDDYVHRIGRTGRAGREGTSLTLVTGDDLKAIGEIEKIIGEKSTWLGEPPTEEEIADGARRKRGRGRGGAARDSRGGAARGDRGGAARGDHGGAARSDRSEAPRDRDASLLDTRSGPTRDRDTGDTPSRGRRREPRLHDAPIDAPRADAPLRGPFEQVGSTPDAMAERSPSETFGTREPREEGGMRRRRGRRGGPRRDGEAARLDAEAPGHGEQPHVVERRDNPRPARSAEPREAHRDEPRHSPRDQPRDGRNDDRHRGPGRDRDRDRNHRNEPRAPQRQEYNLAPEGRPVRQRDSRRDREGGNRVGFEDNVPAFLRKPARA
jgi:superfamily II DNA/RNA helicase